MARAGRLVVAAIAVLLTARPALARDVFDRVHDG
jgi:hypothetical protein